MQYGLDRRVSTMHTGPNLAEDTIWIIDYELWTLLIASALRKQANVYIMTWRSILSCILVVKLSLVNFQGQLKAPLPHLFLLLLSIYSPTLATKFLFNGFKEAANLSLDASALITSNGILQLTNGSKRQIGHAFLSSPVHMLHRRSVVTSFSTAFVFEIVTVNGGGGEGLAFVVATSKTLPGAQNGQFLGLLSTQNNGNFSNHLFAIEFDTVKATGPFNDIDKNHIGVDVNSLESNVAKPAAYYADGGNKVSIELLSAQPNQAWINYNGVTGILNVTIAPLRLPRPRRPLISHAIDLSPIFKEYMYVGFSAATGNLTSHHYILGWSFSTDGVGSSLDPSQLPLSRQKDASPASRFRRLKITLGVFFGLLSSIALIALLIKSIKDGNFLSFIMLVAQIKDRFSQYGD
ncbi:unnamed protein product [Musa acuminata subsp. malaccensis]|uniref:(wild Malaysian banana) hypothetical protein n=1 Tax=Musa acuminata subsp. malaccensis TaxID=214687 RepID=A0A804I9C4_MUSAM|nr:unnamed protein product [Musa acuminata subsp. malaccensis]